VFLVALAVSQQAEVLTLPGIEECLLVSVVTEECWWQLQTWLVQLQFLSGVFAVSEQKLLDFEASADSLTVAVDIMHEVRAQLGSSCCLYSCVFAASWLELDHAASLGVASLFLLMPVFITR